jgi:hypothetical protein
MPVIHAEKRRILKTEDSLAERVGFELAGDFSSPPVKHLKRQLDDILSTRTRTPPDTIAETYWHLAHQGRSSGGRNSRSVG